MLEQTFKPGDQTSFGSDSLTQPHSAYFEDDGETGYFYAMDLTRSVDMIVDAVHIYNVANISDRERGGCSRTSYYAIGKNMPSVSGSPVTGSHAAIKWTSDAVAERGSLGKLDSELVFNHLDNLS